MVETPDVPAIAEDTSVTVGVGTADVPDTTVGCAVDVDDVPTPGVKIVVEAGTDDGDAFPDADTLAFGTDASALTAVVVVVDPECADTELTVAVAETTDAGTEMFPAADIPGDQIDADV